MIDERGRLFGRVNLVDALVLAIVVIVIPLVYGAFVLFRQPVPRIGAISPDHIVEQRETTLRVTGEHLRAFLAAQVNDTPAVAFLIQSTTNADVKLPPLPAGVYDLVLFDVSTEVARMPRALTVSASRVNDAVVTVKFVALPEFVKRLRPGDKDVSGAAAANQPANQPGGAVLTEIGSDQQTVTGSIVNFRGEGPLQSREPAVPFLVQQNMVAFTGLVRVSLTSTPSGWTFRNRPVKIGSPFTFESSIGVMDGVVVDVQVPPSQ